jgi:hypothetical protein
MPNWSDDEGHYWWCPPNKGWLEGSVQIPHAPVTKQEGCGCEFCTYDGPKDDGPPVTEEQVAKLLGLAGLAVTEAEIRFNGLDEHGEGQLEIELVDEYEHTTRATLHVSRSWWDAVTAEWDRQIKERG